MFVLLLHCVVTHITYYDEEPDGLSYSMHLQSWLRPFSSLGRHWGKEKPW